MRAAQPARDPGRTWQGVLIPHVLFSIQLPVLPCEHVEDLPLIELQHWSTSYHVGIEVTDSNIRFHPFSSILKKSEKPWN
jgi:hypothetical protein